MRKSILTKFSGISYPIFVLKQAPIKVIYESEKILCKVKTDGTIQTLDDKSIEGDYFGRLLKMEHRVHFDFTCKNLQELLMCKGKWGIDKEAVPHDLSQLYSVQAECRQVVKVHENLIWLKDISYPFTLPTHESITIKDTMYATTVCVSGEWYLRELTMDKVQLSRPYMYV